jgi:hypothetical protein
MRNVPRVRLGGRDAYALPSVLIFSLILIIAGLAFFSMASYETRQAIYRQSSSRAFYLADGAIERARSEFLNDRGWAAGYNGARVTGAGGTYDLVVRDSTYQSYPHVKFLRATGHFRNADRRIEVLAQVPPTALALPLLVMGDASVGGNLCLSGDAHINGEASGSNPAQDPHFVCGGDYTEGFTILPPPIHTEPDSFPGATYYYVKGNKVGGTWQAKIFDRDGNDITAGHIMTDVVTYNAGSKTFTYDFKNAGLISTYFDEASGVFRKNAGDNSVVVNFGEVPVVDPPGALGVSAVTLDGDASYSVRSTVINARYVGVTEMDRLDASYWRGALLTVKQIMMEPRNGIALIAYDFEKQGGSLVTIGTPAWPALVYVTRDVTDITSNFNLLGSIICLGDWNSTGGPDVTYDAAFIPHLPPYLQDNWPDGISGTLKIFRWREAATAGS